MPKETIGIDLGDKMSRYCIVNQDGEVVQEGSFRNQVSSLETLDPYRKSPGGSPWKPGGSQPGSAGN